MLKREVEEIIENGFKLFNKLMTDKGSIKYSTCKDVTGPFQTLEALLPLLLYPIRKKNQSDIIRSLRYILSEVQKSKDGSIVPHPECDRWHEGAVDSSAYGIYVLGMALHYFEGSIDDLSFNLITKIRKVLPNMIKYIESQINTTGGWGFVKLNSLKSRTYSTALVLSALSICPDDVFSLSNLKKIALIQNGQKYLMESQDSTSGGWKFSDDDLRIHPNITAVAIFGLVNSLCIVEDVEIKRAIDMGTKYILNTVDFIRFTYKNSNGQDESLIGVKENLLLPISVSRGQKRPKFEIQEYDQPMHMILPALLNSGYVGYEDWRINNILSHINTTFDENVKQYKNKPLDSSCAIEVWEISDVIFSNISYLSVKETIQSCYKSFLNVGSPIDRNMISPDIIKFRKKAEMYSYLFFGLLGAVTLALAIVGYLYWESPIIYFTSIIVLIIDLIIFLRNKIERQN